MTKFTQDEALEIAKVRPHTMFNGRYPMRPEEITDALNEVAARAVERLHVMPGWDFNAIAAEYRRAKP